jgi:choline dehydrogenase
MRRLAAAGPLGRLVESEVMPGAQAQSDDEVLLAFRTNAQTAYHSVGTCAMGTDPDSVTDPELRVRGTEGLRVVDAGVMPSLPGPHTNGQTMALAWRAADHIVGLA